MKRIPRLFLLAISLLFVPQAQAGYILSTNATGVSYSGTTDPWVSNDSVTGRQIGNGTDAITVSFAAGNVDIVSTDNNSPLVIDNATVSAPVLRIGTSATAPGELTIRNGSVVTVSGRIIVNDHGAATILVDNGTLIGASSGAEGGFELGYHGAATIDLVNGGRLFAGNRIDTPTAYYDINVGGRSAGGTASTVTNLTLGKADGSDTVGGTITCKKLNLSYKSDTNVNVYKGSILATEGIAAGEKKSFLNIGADGIVTVGTTTAATAAGLTVVGGKTATVSSLTASSVYVGTYSSWGSLVVGGSGTADSVTIGDGTAGQKFDATRGGADFTAAETVTINVDSVSILSGPPPSSVSRASYLKLGASNTITANSLSMVDSTGSNYTGASSTLKFGAANTLNIDTLTLGGTKAQGTDGKCVVVGITDNGTLTLNGKSGTDSAAKLYVAYNNQNETGNSSYSSVDLSNGGAINMKLSDLYVGRNMSSIVTTTAAGELKLGTSGTVTADNLWLGTVRVDNGGTASGLLTTAGTNVTATTLKLGDQSTSTSSISASKGTIYTPNSVTAVGASSVTLTGTAKFMVGNNTAAIVKGLFVAGGKELSIGSIETTKLTVGLHDYKPGSSSENVTENGKLTVGTAGNSDFVRVGSGATDDMVVIPKGQVDFSAVETVTMNVRLINMLTNPLKEGINSDIKLILGKDNTITADKWTMLTTAAGANLIGSTAAVEFGEGTNDVNVESWIVGGIKAQGKTVDGKITGASITIRDGGSFDLAGKTDGTKANLYIAYNKIDSGSGTSNSSVGSMDLSNAASVNMALGELVIGYANNISASSNNVTNGELILGDHATISADSITMATQSGKPATKGTLSFGGDTTVTVAGAITMGNTSKSEAVLNMSGGVLKAAALSKTGDNSAFNWTGGELCVDEINFNLTQNGETAVLSPAGADAYGTTTIDGDYNLEVGKILLKVSDTEKDFLKITGDLTFGADASLIVDGSELTDVSTPITLFEAGNNPMIDVSKIVAQGFAEGVAFSWAASAAGGFEFQVHRSADVPEPATWSLLILGAAGVWYWRKRR